MSKKTFSQAVIKAMKMQRSSVVAAMPSVQGGAAPAMKSMNTRMFTSAALKSTTVVQAPFEASKPALFFGGGSKASAGTISESEVRSLFNLWNDALATLDSDKVASRYSSNPILLPTVSDTPRTDYATIKDYFDNFLKLKPQGVISEGKIVMGDGWAQDAGIYEFTMGATGDKVKARYTFTYVKEGDEWKISHHHSSTMPEQKPSIDEAGAKQLFHLWNDALATCKSTPSRQTIY